eukprot:306220_1
MSVSKRKTKSRKRKIEDVENDTNIVLSAGTNPTKRRRLNDTEDGNKENKNNIFNGKDPKSYTVKQLKDLCRKQKLKVGGNKTQLIARLLNPPKAEKSAKAKNKSRTGRLSTKRVDNMLKEHGVNNPQSVSNCLKKGIQRGHVIIDSEEGLDGILIEGSCICCSTRHVVKIRDVLYQRDYAGMDYEDGGQDAEVQCDDCCGLYVTGICDGRPRFDSGKFHNHCTECPGFGKCIGDYREAHCDRCGKHYFPGLSGFACDYCKRR